MSVPRRGARRALPPTDTALGTGLGSLIGGRRYRDTGPSGAAKSTVEILAHGSHLTHEETAIVELALTEWINTHPDHPDTPTARDLLGRFNHAP